VPMADPGLEVSGVSTIYNLGAPVYHVVPAWVSPSRKWSFACFSESSCTKKERSSWFVPFHVIKPQFNLYLVFSGSICHSRPASPSELGWYSWNRGASYKWGMTTDRVFFSIFPRMIMTANWQDTIWASDPHDWRHFQFNSAVPHFCQCYISRPTWGLSYFVHSVSFLCSDKQAWSVYSISLYASQFSFYHYRTIHIHYRSILDIIVTNNIPMSRAGLIRICNIPKGVCCGYVINLRQERTLWNAEGTSWNDEEYLSYKRCQFAFNLSSLLSFSSGELAEHRRSSNTSSIFSRILISQNVASQSYWYRLGHHILVSSV
jgi:hypothetical protein